MKKLWKGIIKIMNADVEDVDDVMDKYLVVFTGLCILAVIPLQILLWQVVLRLI